MASGDLSLTSNSSQEESSDYVGYTTERTIRPSSNSSGSTTANINNNNPSKKCDIIKQQFDQAMMELGDLRMQHSETMRSYKEMQSELQFFREQYMAAMKQLESSAKERSKYADLTNENSRLTQQNVHLERKLRRFMESVKKQEKESIANSQPGFQLYDHYSDLPHKACEGGCIESSKYLEELKICKKLYNDLNNEHGALCAEKDKLLVELSAAYSELEREKKVFREARDQLIMQQEKEMKEIQALLLARGNEVIMTKMDRNRVKEELDQILSEKDNVLQESQKVSDDLVAVCKELEQKKKDEARIKNELKILQQNNYELKQKVEKLEKRELLKSRESNWSKEFSEANEDFKEVEKLRKALEKARGEVDKAVQETEIAKSRRDWAISEREKIVQERDSVKTLCDELRKERDKAISDWLSAIRDSEKIKKQKDEACKEVDILKDQLDSQMSNSRRSFRFSAPPSDFVDFFEVELTNYHQNDDMGIVLDDSGNRQLICGITNQSPAFGKLKINDVIVKVNDMDCQAISKRIVIDAIRSNAPRCTLLICRTKQSKRHMYTVHLNLQDNPNHGLNLETGVFISKIQQNSLASFEPELDVGDRILSINNKSMEGVQSAKEAMNILEDHRQDVVTIYALKNIQDVSYGDVKRRTANTSAQTDSCDSVNKVSSTKQISKISEMINKFRERMHITKSGTDADSFSQENDALAALDSVLSENSDKSKENLFKRSKRGKKEKDSSKSIGTWPRAAILNTVLDNPTGTIGQHVKKQRAALSLFTGPINVDKEEPENYFKSPSPQISPQKLQTHGSNSSSGSSKQNPNRNSIPIQANLFQSNQPNSYLQRHSVYATTMETEPILLDPPNQPISGNTSSRSGQVNPNLRIKIPENRSRYATNSRHNHNHYQNRYSLNLTPSDNSLIYKTSGQTAQQQISTQQNSIDFIPKKSQQDAIPRHSFTPTNLEFKGHHSSSSNQQNSLDVISLKSQNSIDSFLLPKSPQIHDFSAPFTKRPAPNKNVSKYPSDSESIGMENVMSMGHIHMSNSSNMPPTSLLFAPNMTTTSTNHRHVPLFPSFPAHVHPHPHRMRHSSPLTLPISTHSIEHPSGIPGSGGVNSVDKFDSDYLPSSHHAYNVSAEYPYHRSRMAPTRDHDDPPTSYYNVYEGGTFPRKKEHRFRIPSNPSVTSKGSGVKNSTGSIEHHGSERGSPMPPVHVEILSHGANKRNSNVPDFLCPGDLRRVTIDKSDKPLGITIQCNNNGGGIFVSSVTEKSIASRAGLQVGDQLLEVCGINMRSATKDIAANVLRQCGNSITMLVQYNPEKYDGHNLEPESVTHSGSPTPRNSPRAPRSLVVPTTTSAPSPVISSATPKSSVMSGQIKSQQFSDSLENQSDSSQHCSADSIFEEEARIITLHVDKGKNLNIKLIGGNQVGIFVHDVQRDSPAELAGIRKGDQILEYNGVDLRCVTAEQAANEIARFTDTVTLLVQNNLQKLNQIQDNAGDSFYIRAGFDRTGELGEGELRFVKDEVLYVDNTIFRGVFGQWRAWKLDAYGHRKECGIIPSQSKVEEELRLLGDIVDCDGGTTRRGSTSARRSFFRRKKHHRSSSRDSKELASFSNTQLSYFSDSGMLSDEGSILSYQRVERLDHPVCRPVLVLGPLSECVTDRLTIDFPQLFQHCIMTEMNCSQEAMEEGLQKNIFVDYRRKNNIFECTTVQSIRNICENNRHCILDVCISAVERLQRLKIYPIVLLLRFKSAKQIKEIKDSRYPTDKISAKSAKEMYERASKLESDYKQYISAVIPAGVNITHMSTQIKASVVEEQSRVLWVPVSNS